MINEEKVRLMTKLTLFEEVRGKKMLPLSKYYKEDYISTQMIKSFILGTFAYFILLGMIALYQMEEFVNSFLSMDILNLVTFVVAGYVIFMFLYLLLTYIISYLQYKRAKKSIKAYVGILKKVERIYAREESDTKPINW